MYLVSSLIDQVLFCCGKLERDSGKVIGTSQSWSAAVSQSRNRKLKITNTQIDNKIYRFYTQPILFMCSFNKILVTTEYPSVTISLHECTFSVTLNRLLGFLTCTSLFPTTGVGCSYVRRTILIYQQHSA